MTISWNPGTTRANCRVYFNYSVCPLTDISFGRAPRNFHHKGRVIRRLVALHHGVNDMLAEADRRAHDANTGVTVNYTHWFMM